MKKLCLIASLAGVLAAPSVFASMTITLSDDTANYSYNNGGEFQAVGNQALNSAVNWSAYSTSTAVKGTSFQTFCTEELEEFYPGTQYQVTSIGNAALYNGGTQPVPITLGVAYLYSQFAAGTLAGYDYTYGSGRANSAGNLQQAIWYLLGEYGDSAQVTGVALADLDAVTGHGKLFASSADWTVAANGAFGVADMVLSQPGQAQDQLVMAVPEPTTMIAGLVLLLPFGASTLRILRKNRVA
jgi:hypothetical protein